MQTDSADCETGRLSSCLRRTTYLAQDARAGDIERWCRLELGGYVASNPAMGEDIVVPEYRTVVGQHVDVFGAVLVLPTNLAFVNETRLRNGAEELEVLVNSRSTVIIHDPNMCGMIRQHLGVEVYSFRFSAVHLAGVLSAIRTEVETKIRSLGITDSQDRPRTISQGQDILQIRPNVYGIGVDLRALWRRWRGTK
ncbi:MAG: hypothetical protein L0387_10455 [Acidobacteria bacterium]|nr:hypothetical protein [Acidobacteriota bacterium]